MARRRKIGRAGAVSPVPFIGMALMAVTLFLYVYAVVIVPWFVLIAMLLLWLFLMLECVRVWSSHPRRLIAIPIFATVVWAGIVIGGAFAFDWQPIWDPGIGGKVPNQAEASPDPVLSGG